VIIYDMRVNCYVVNTLWVLVDVLNICEDASKDMIGLARVVLRLILLHI
jgi:hypothetical protein